MTKPDDIEQKHWDAARKAIVKQDKNESLSEAVARAIQSAANEGRNKACRQIEKICYAGEQLTGWIRHPDAVGEVANWRIQQIEAYSFIHGADPKASVKAYIDAISGNVEPTP